MRSSRSRTRSRSNKHNNKTATDYDYGDWKLSGGEPGKAGMTWTLDNATFKKNNESANITLEYYDVAVIDDSEMAPAGDGTNLDIQFSSLHEAIEAAQDNSDDWMHENSKQPVKLDCHKYSKDDNSPDDAQLWIGVARTDYTMDDSVYWIRPHFRMKYDDGGLIQLDYGYDDYDNTDAQVYSLKAAINDLDYAIANANELNEW